MRRSLSDVFLTSHSQSSNSKRASWKEVSILGACYVVVEKYGKVGKCTVLLGKVRYDEARHGKVSQGKT